MLTASTDHSTRRLLTAVETVAAMWLVLLPLLRPLVWSGQPTDIANLFYLVLLAAAITTGLLQRGLSAPLLAEQPVSWWRRPLTWGVAFLAFACVGSALSPLPAAAWTLTVGWALHLGAPLALWPMIQRCPHLVLAGLLAGLVGEGLLMVGQVLVERPQLAQHLASDPSLTVEQRIADQYQARIGSWRLEGTFLLANTLGSYLVMVVPLVCSLVWQRRHQPGLPRWIGAGAALLALLALAMTGSKAAIAAMVIAVATTVVVRQTTSRARLQVGGGMLGVIGLLVAIVLAVPVARTALLGSADVRVDYWRAGVALVAERPLLGHGLEGFSVQFPRVKLPGGEETVLAHQETLQAAVDLGLPAAVVLVGWWIALLATMRPTTGGLIPRAAATGIPPTALIVMSLILLFACSAAGVLSANLGAYPGLPPFAWAVVLNVMVLGVAWHVARGPLPSAHACWCAILACLLHVQADFSLHSMQVVGVLAWVACLGRVVAAPVPAEPAASATNELGSPRRQGLFAAAGLLVLGVVTVGIIASAERGEVLERARASEAILARLRLADAGRLDERQRLAVFDAFESAVSHVVVEDGRAALTSDPREALAMAMIRRAVEASRRFPADHDLVFAAIALGEHLQALLPARASVLTPVWENLLAEWPQSLLVIKSLSEHYLRVGRAAAGDEQRRYARQAQALAMRAVELYPTHLPLRQTLIRAAELTGDQATVDAQRAEITRLTPLVHRDNRVRESAR